MTNGYDGVGVPGSNGYDTLTGAARHAVNPSTYYAQVLIDSY